MINKYINMFISNGGAIKKTKKSCSDRIGMNNKYSWGNKIVMERVHTLK